MVDRALPLDPEDRAVAGPPVALQHELLGGAGDEVADHLVDGDAPPGDRDPGLAGGHELGAACPGAWPRGRAPGRPSSCPARSRSRRPARCAPTRRGWRRWARPGRPGARRRSRSSTPARGGRGGQLGVVAEEIVKAALDVQPGRQRLQHRRPERRRQLAAGRRDPDQHHVGPNAAAPRPGWRPPGRPGQPGHVVARRSLPALRRVDDSHGLGVGVAHDAGGGLRVLVEAALAEHDVALHGHCSSGVTPSPGPAAGDDPPVVEAEAGEGVVGVQQVTVQVDDVDQRRDRCRRRRCPGWTRSCTPA